MSRSTGSTGADRRTLWLILAVILSMLATRAFVGDPVQGGGFPIGACLATTEAARGMTVGVHGFLDGLVIGFTDDV